jgi:hypothetical protein
LTKYGGGGRTRLLALRFFTGGTRLLPDGVGTAQPFLLRPGEPRTFHFSLARVGTLEPDDPCMPRRPMRSDGLKVGGFTQRSRLRHGGSSRRLPRQLPMAAAKPGRLAPATGARTLAAARVVGSARAFGSPPGPSRAESTSRLLDARRSRA